MKKLTITELAPYLPYKVMVVYKDCLNESKIQKAFLTGITFSEIETTYKRKIKGCAGDFISWNGNNNVHDLQVKLILRPLSDLTKEIEIDGKKIIPLIELYRCSNEYNYNEDLDYEFIDSWGHKGNILKVFHNREKDEYTEFVFSELSFRKERKHLKGSYVFGMDLPHNIAVDSKLYNNNKLYNLLYMWHFDVFGLIEKGLAVDINALQGK